MAFAVTFSGRCFFGPPVCSRRHSPEGSLWLTACARLFPAGPPTNTKTPLPSPRFPDEYFGTGETLWAISSRPRNRSDADRDVRKDVTTRRAAPGPD